MEQVFTVQVPHRRVEYRLGVIGMTSGRPTIITDAVGNVIEFIPHPELDLFGFEVVAEHNGSRASIMVTLGADAGRALVTALAQVGKTVLDMEAQHE